MRILLHYLSQHLEAFIGWVVTLFAALITASIPLIRRGHTSHNRGAEKGARERQRLGEQLLLKYTQEALPDSKLSRVQILNMAHPHKLEDLYVPLRVQPEGFSQSLLDARIRQAEEMHDPDLYLQAELDLLERYMSVAIDPVEAMRMYKQMVVIGEPGSGKTTLLRYLALQSAKKQLRDLPTLPFYVELNRFDARKQGDLLDLLVASLGDFAPFTDPAFAKVTDPPFVKELLCEKMRAGQAILLLDGLDETRIGVDQDEARQAYSFLTGEIKRLTGLYTSMPIIVTVRKAYYQQSSKLEGFHEVEVAGFRPEDSQTFAKNWFQDSPAEHSAEAKSRDLQARVEESLRVRTLISNPLLLTLAAIIYESHLNLPENRAEFYRLCVQECIEALQSKWDARRNIKRSSLLSVHKQLHLLQEVAWHFHTQGRYAFPQEELLVVIEEFLPGVAIPPDQAKTVLEEITRANGLLREQAPEIYSFSHLTFQEYFAAQYLNVHRNEDELIQYLNNPWWEQVALFYANMHDESWLLNILLGHRPEQFIPDTLFHTHLLLAGRCLAEKPLIREVTLREEIAKRLFDLLLTTPYALLRERAATTLAMISGQSINGKLLNVLEAPHSGTRAVRECIGDALGASGERQLATELVEFLKLKSERSLRLVITRALGRLGNHTVIPALLGILGHEPEDVYVQQMIALTLAEFKESAVANELLGLLEKRTTDPMVQRGIIIALGILGNQPVERKLLDILHDDTRDSLVRAAAAKALGKIGLAELAPEMSLVLENPQDTIYVRQRVATAMGALYPTEQVTPYLLYTLEKAHVNAEVQCSIAEALGMTGAKQVAHNLLRLLHQKQFSLEVRANIILALGYLGNACAPVLDDLQKLLQSRQLEAELRVAILAALGMLGIRTVTTELLRILADAEAKQDMQEHILHALNCLSHHRAIDKGGIAYHLALLLQEEYIDRYLKENIASLLQSLGDHTVLSFLQGLLANQRIDRAIRQQIAEFVGQFADDTTQLALLLKSTDITDDIFRAYWAVDRRIRGRSFSNESERLRL